jgi:phytoene dehydrogenase-like protein
MGRGAAWVLGTGLALVLLATPARAQVHVDIGVVAPPVGARVVVGPPRVYVADRYYEPVYARYDRHWRRDRSRERAKREREYYKDVREARREYEKDRREAEREYRKDVREARREYEKDRREARRDRRW